jgi:FkbM family methyltransferase
MSSSNESSPFASLPEDDAHDALSQIKQDLFVLKHLGGKERGYFVEFGASDGKTLSNTWLLEKRFGWRGLLAEPSHHWHDLLKANRPGPIDTRCIWKETGCRLPFHETQDNYLSGLDGPTCPITSTYEVETVTLSDLLNCHSSPPLIDYLSMDTEGSELDILQRFTEDNGFDRYKFNAITVEHNFNPTKRQAIMKLLTERGCQRVHEKLSDFDDWYVSM